ncbi:MAG TPA: hypothetical protein VJA21_18355 [Verrucomicrobiae bacterium]
MNAPTLRRTDAFSLVELIGVLAVIAVLLAILIPSGIRTLDRIAAEKEVATLKTLGDRFQKAILRQRMIPAQPSWASFIAAEAGMSSNSVSVNPRYKTRAFIADPGGWLGTHLPFTNAPNGSATYPATARVMFVSSLGAELPDLESGMNAAEFQKLWDAPDGTVPDSSSSPLVWKLFEGDPQDVKVQRINLGPLFHNLVLSTYTAATNGQFRIDGSALTNAATGAGYSAYYLDGTAVDLVTGSPENKTNHAVILNQDGSFVYEYGIWRNSIMGGETYGLGDISGIVAAFLKATPNQNANLPWTNAQQVAIVNSFISYLSNYSNWAESDPSFPATFRPDMVTIQKQMMSNVWGIFVNNKLWNADPLSTHYPTNASACVNP